MAFLDDNIVTFCGDTLKCSVTLQQHIDMTSVCHTLGWHFVVTVYSRLFLTVVTLWWWILYIGTTIKSELHFVCDTLGVSPTGDTVVLTLTFLTVHLVHVTEEVFGCAREAVAVSHSTCAGRREKIRGETGITSLGREVTKQRYQSHSS